LVCANDSSAAEFLSIYFKIVSLMCVSSLFVSHREYKMSTDRNVFYRLVTRDGLPYADTDADFVMCSSTEKIMSLVKMVHAMNSAILSWCTSSQLKVHPDRVSLNIANGALLKESALGESYGKYSDQPLLVLVPVHSLSPQVINPVSDAQLSQRLRWLPEPEKTYSLKHQEMFFVNRDHAIEDLVEIHAQTYCLAHKHGAGFMFQIALIDNLLGAGKTAFAENYISKSSDALRKLSDALKTEECPPELKTEGYSPKFVDSLSRARTVTVRMRPGMFLASLSDDAPGVMDNAVRQQFVVAIELVIGKRELEGTTSFLMEDLSRTCGFDKTILRFISDTRTPLFLVFDEVGTAFEDDAFSLKEQRDCFLKFCSRVLSPCLMIADFYLLLIGKADFLTRDANRSPFSPSLSTSTVDITRIGLN